MLDWVRSNFRTNEIFYDVKKSVSGEEFENGGTKVHGRVLSDFIPWQRNVHRLEPVASGFIAVHELGVEVFFFYASCNSPFGHPAFNELVE